MAPTTTCHDVLINPSPDTAATDSDEKTPLKDEDSDSDEDYPYSDSDEDYPYEEATATPDQIVDYLQDLERRLGGTLGKKARREADEFFKRVLSGTTRFTDRRDGRTGSVGSIDIGYESDDLLIRFDYNDGSYAYDTGGALAANHLQKTGSSGKYDFFEG